MGLIAFGAVNALACIVALLAAPRARGLRSARRRARRLLILRLFPGAFSVLFVAAAFVPAFLRHEPPVSSERVTPAMFGLAIAAASMLVLGPLRALRAGLATRRLERRWRRSVCPATLSGVSIPAWVIEDPFPVVAVVGVVRPRLYVARRVLDGCTPAELAAVMCHETGHVESRDNGKRFLLHMLPDWLALTPWGSRLERAWGEAAEDAADDRAARAGSASDLASALVKVARLAVPFDSRHAPALALYRGQGIERRVGRLLRAPDASPSSGDRAALSAGSVLLALGVVLGGHDGLLRRVHDLTEAAVRLLQ
jgi:Zn-dependent protease with chaperone function